MSEFAYDVSGTEYVAAFSPRPWRMGPCGKHERPSEWRIVTASPLDIELGVIDNELARLDQPHTHLTIDMRAANHTPDVTFSFSGPERTRSRVIRLTPDGIDLDGDGQPEVTILAKGIDRLWLNMNGDAHDINLDTTNSTIKPKNIWIYSSYGDDKISVKAPGAEVVVRGERGNDTITIASRRSGATGGAGNDIINARGTTHGGGYGGGAGNDRLLLGPGNDSSSEEYAASGNDYYDTGAGNDHIRDYVGNDTFHMGPGNDQVNVRGSATTWETVNLGPGNDTGVISGKSARIKMNGGSGNDSIFAPGNINLHSLINCGTGNDYLRARHYGREHSCERADPSL